MIYEFVMHDGQKVEINQPDTFKAIDYLEDMNNPRLMSIKVGNSLLNKNNVAAIIPTGDTLIDLGFELALNNEVRIGKGTHNNIDLNIINETINTKNYFEFAGALINRSQFSKIVPIEANLEA